MFWLSQILLWRTLFSEHTQSACMTIKFWCLEYYPWFKSTEQGRAAGLWWRSYSSSHPATLSMKHLQSDTSELQEQTAHGFNRTLWMKERQDNLKTRNRKAREDLTPVPWQYVGEISLKLKKKQFAACSSAPSLHPGKSVL